MEIGTFESEYVYNGFNTNFDSSLSNLYDNNILIDNNNNIYFYDKLGYCYYKIHNYHDMLFLNDKKINKSYVPTNYLDLKKNINNDGNEETNVDFLYLSKVEQKEYLNQQYVSYLKNNNCCFYDNGKTKDLSNVIYEHLNICKVENKEYINKLITKTNFEIIENKQPNSNKISDGNGDANTNIYFDKFFDISFSKASASDKKLTFDTYFDKYSFISTPVKKEGKEKKEEEENLTIENGIAIKTIFKYENEELYEDLSEKIQERTTRFDMCHFFIIKNKKKYYPVIILHDINRYRIFLLFFNKLKLEGKYYNETFTCSTDIRSEENHTVNLNSEDFPLIIDLDNKLKLNIQNQNAYSSDINFFVYKNECFFL